jgi:hypothetical protein
MDLYEVVCEVAERDSGGMILNLLAEGICQTCEAPIRHAHGQIMAFNEGR